jgi:hypothetical protein
MSTFGALWPRIQCLCNVQRTFPLKIRSKGESVTRAVVTFLSHLDAGAAATGLDSLNHYGITRESKLCENGATISAEQMSASGWHTYRDIVSDFRQRIAGGGSQQSVRTYFEMNVAGSAEAFDEHNAPG